MILGMLAASLGEVSEYHFSPHDFDDNIQGRNFILINDEMIHFSYDPDAIIYDDEGRIIGEDLLSWKFSIASGAYKVLVNYKTDADNAYVELYSDSWISEPVSEMIPLSSENTIAVSKLYIPFGRSMHDVQMNIHYIGPGNLDIYSITLSEMTSYRWVPLVGFIILFIILDLFLFIVYARSGVSARSWIRKNWQIPALLTIAFLASLPAFTDYIYVGHDIRFHLARIMAISHEIAYGQFPVRMLTDMLHGYSYPTSTFYCDIFLYPYALLYNLGLPMHMCWQTNIIVLNLLTVWISYAAFRKISERRDIGVTGAAIYTLSAYRIVDIYLRSALGEFTALTFIPLILLGIWMIYYEKRENRTGWLCLGGGMAAIAMSHLLSLEMISLFLVIFCLLEYRLTFTVYRISSIVKAAVMTVLLSAWFVFPMLIYMSQVSLSMNDHMKYIQMSGAYPSQIFSLFMQGVGFSGTGTSNEMPLSIGGGMIAALALLIYRIIKADCGDRHKQKTALTLAVISLVISMYFFPWDSLASISESRLPAVSNIIRVVQFPWRYLEITTAILCLTAIYGLKCMAGEEKTFGFRLWIGILLLGTIISADSFFVNFVSEAKTTRVYSEEYINNEIAFEEYLPSGSGRVVDLPIEPETDSDNIQIISYESSGGERKLSVTNNGEDANVLIPVFDYPGYHAEDTDTNEMTRFESGDNARIKLQIPSGYAGTVKIYYREPLLWRIFEIISLTAFISYGAFIVKTIIEKRKECDCSRKKG